MNAGPEAIGLVVIITNDYSSCPGLPRLSGAHLDGIAISDAFRQLKFAVYWIKNATRHSLENVMWDLQNLELFSMRKCRCIIFIFAGHVSEGDNLIMQDGSQFQIIKDIICPLSKNSNEIKLVQKIFLIDACRGKGVAQTSFVPGGASQRGGSLIGIEEVAQEDGFMLVYSTHEAYENRLWLSTMARLLRDKQHLCSVDNLLTAISKELEGRMGGFWFQQPERFSQLYQDICLDPGCSCR